MVSKRKCVDSDASNWRRVCTMCSSWSPSNSASIPRSSVFYAPRLFHRLCDLDGKKIAEVNELIAFGAYVLVPVGQKFRDTWFILPDNAVDTSTNPGRWRLNNRRTKSTRR